MELALSLGERPKPFPFHEKTSDNKLNNLGFCMAQEDKDGGQKTFDPPIQLDLLPFSPVHRTHPNSSNKFPFPWLTHKLGGEPGKRTDVNRKGDEKEEGSSPNSVVSSFQMGFSIFRNRKRDLNCGVMINEGHDHMDRGSSKGSDDDEINGMARKKLRLTKEQSVFLEESFKAHNTLNPKQKLALAKQLNLRPRQVEVWFQNRRARTKLKQTEVDCEYLKRCCETLTEENRRLQKELQELRALKATQPFYRQLPPTTLTMCPSCEKVATTTTTTSTAVAAPSVNLSTNKANKLLSLSPVNGHDTS